MARNIEISPVTRINGLWHLTATVDQGKVVKAQSSGLYFRGVELILRGRDPRDAGYITERICGICSTAHATAAVFALENALKLEVPAGAERLRNLIFGADILQNHIRHFYLFLLPDFLETPQLPHLKPQYKGDYRVPKAIQEKIWEHYLEQLDISRQTHEMVTIFGGKAPHQHGIVVGGASVQPTADRIRLFGSMLENVRRFIDEKMIPDAEIIAHYYDDYYKLGIGYQREVVYPTFPIPDRKDNWEFPGGIVSSEGEQPLNVSKITEDVRYAWYNPAEPVYPAEGVTKPNLAKQGGYTWVKAPRYGGKAYNTGPLSRLILLGKYPKRFSAMDRIMARVQETKLITDLMGKWYRVLDPQAKIYEAHDLPASGEGFGITGSMRGALGHWIKFEHGRITNYQVVTPSAWNCSPMDENGQRGPIEEALIDTPIEDEENPVEIGRIARSFDPCLSCAIQLIKGPLEGKVNDY